MASYNIFNYNYRPAKSIERKLFAELLKEVYGVSPGSDCTYIGLGSVFFTDFRTIHKELNINKMINVEMNEDDKKRFEFNKPYSCIKLEWGKTTDILPFVDWSGRKIIWLDYDQTLQPYMFEDIDTVFANANPGSFFLMSCNSSLPRYVRPNGKHKLEKFQNDFNGLTPLNITKDDLTKNCSPNLIYKMVSNRIKSVLNNRNAALQDADQVIYHQMILIVYQDGAPMITLGGYLLRSEDHKIFAKDRINKLPYVRLKEEALDLQSPVVTTQELDVMNNYLPNYPSRFMSVKKIGFIPDEERKKYIKTYRYYPNFVEIRD